MLMTEKKRNERKCAKAIRAEGRGAGLTEKKKTSEQNPDEHKWMAKSNVPVEKAEGARALR